MYTAHNTNFLRGSDATQGEGEDVSKEVGIAQSPSKAL